MSNKTNEEALQIDFLLIGLLDNGREGDSRVSAETTYKIQIKIDSVQKLELPIVAFSRLKNDNQK